jgi:hypothetical protein
MAVIGTWHEPPHGSLSLNFCSKTIALVPDQGLFLFPDQWRSMEMTGVPNGIPSGRTRPPGEHIFMCNPWLFFTGFVWFSEQPWLIPDSSCL